MAKSKPIVVLLLAASCSISAPAAEIAFKDRCRPRSSIVTLGDVAEIHSADAADALKLARVELFNAPAAAEKPPTYSYREIAELLRIRGVDLSQHELSGATQVTIEVAPVVQPATAVPPGDARAQEIVSAAIIDYLKGRISHDVQWKVEASVGDVAGIVQARVLQAPEFSASDLSAASGTHTFVLELRGNGNTWQRTVQARVSLPPLVVVASQALSKGTILRPEHLRLQPSPAPRTTGARPRPTGWLVRLEDAVGRELLQTVTAGQPLDEKSLRRPIVVTKGQLVTVVVTCEGVRIRTAARAKEHGALGDVIQVESTLDRKTYQVRVSGLGTVEVFVQPASLANSE